MSTLEKSHSNCSHCGKDAFNKCTGCLVHVYCGKECQKADWAKHKNACKTMQLENIEKTLARAADLIQQVFFLASARTNMYVIKAVTKLGNTIHVVESERVNTFHTIPDHCLEDEEIKSALLSVCRCNDQHWLLHDVVARTLAGLNVEIKELDCSLKYTPKNVVMDLDGRELNNRTSKHHSVLKVRPKKHRKIWIIDITGAQYGIGLFHEASTYSTIYMESEGIPVEFGKGKKCAQAMASIPTQGGLLCSVDLDTTEQINNTITKWEGIEKTTLADLLHADDKTFTLRKKSMLDHIDASLLDLVNQDKYRDYKQKMDEYKKADPENMIFNHMLESMASI